MLAAVAATAACVCLKLVILIPYWLRRPKTLVCDEIEHAWNSAWVLPDMPAYMDVAVPEVLLTNQSGLVSYIDSNGVMRNKRAPGTNVPPGPLADVLPLRRRAGK